MKILMINNDGGGYADRIEVADGISVALARWFSLRMARCWRPEQAMGPSASGTRRPARNSRSWMWPIPLPAHGHETTLRTNSTHTVGGQQVSRTSLVKPLRSEMILRDSCDSRRY